MHSNSELRHGVPVLVAGLLVNVVFSLPPYVAGIFIAPLNEEFGWSRTDISIGVTILTLGMAAGGLLAGRMMRHCDVRILIACGMMAYAASFLMLSYIGGRLALYWFICGIMTFLGAMASPMTVSRLVADNFTRRRGFALGFTMVGSGIAAALAPLTLVPLVHAHGWRAGYQALAGFSLLLLPLTMLLLSKKGSEYSDDPGRTVAALPQRDTRVLSILIPAVLFISLAVGGAVVHMVPMLTDAGIARNEIASLAGLIGLAIVASRLAVGAIIDRFTANRVATVIMALAAGGFTAVYFGGSFGLLLAPLVVGAGLGAELDLAAYLASRLFPRALYGSRFGILFCAFQVGLALSPTLYAAAHDQFGSYGPAFLMSAILLAASSAMFSRLPDVPSPGRPVGGMRTGDTCGQPLT